MRYLGDFLVGIIFVAIVYSLVRPGSPASGIVQVISNALIAVVGTATGSYITNPLSSTSMTSGGVSV